MLWRHFSAGWTVLGCSQFTHAWILCFQKYSFHLCLLKFFLVSGGFWNLLKRHLICEDFSCSIFLWGLLFSQKKNLQWDLCLCPEADGCRRIAAAFPRSWCRVVLSISPRLTLRQEGSQISGGVCVCTSASHKVWRYSPQWSAQIKEWRLYTFPPFCLVLAFACGCVCENCASEQMWWAWPISPVC